MQYWIDRLYKWLLETQLYNSVYFETYYTTFCYGIIIAIYPWLLNKSAYFDKFKISPSVTYESVSMWFILQSAMFYMAPLMVLDTFLVKKFSGVDPSLWEQKGKVWIQYTRALPPKSPTIFQISYQLIFSFLLFDLLFFFLHFALHKNHLLYRYIHKRHHEHNHIHAHVTNQLSISERITLILSANFALKVFCSHPLTRTIFIPIFIGILVDNHSGYDMPFGLHRLVPFGIVGGSLKHYEHHVSGKRAYQPILIYLDAILKNSRRFSNSVRPKID